MTIIDRTSSSKRKVFLFSRVFATLVMLFAISQAYAQDETFERNPYILSNNSFAISLGSGFNQTQFTSLKGDDKPLPGLGLIPRLNFDYRFSLGDHLGVSLGTGFGFFPFRYKVDAKDDFSGTDGWAYWQIASYEIFSNFKAGVDYNVWLKKRLGLKTGLGGGLMGTSELGATIGSQSQVGAEYYFHYDFTGSFKPYMYLSAQVDRVLKSDDLLGLSLSYEHFFSSIYSGEYALYNNQSNGTLVNRGSNLSLSLVYSFTRARKFKFAEDFFLNEEEVTFKKAKKSFKKERRYIDPKSTFFGLSSGLFYARNQVGFGDHLLKPGGSVSWIVAANFEKGIKKNHFWQAGFSVSETWSYLRLNRPGVFWSSASNAFVSSQVSLGIGTRLISKKSNINFLNVSAGLSVGVNASQKGLSGSSGGTNGSGSEIQYQYLVTYTTKRNIYPTLYTNLSRDFQLTKSLYLSLDYRFNWGVMDVVEGVVEFSEQPELNNVQYDQIGMKGTSNAFQLGIKYKLAPRSK
ncbi:MAG: hypothetical protein GQ574_10230 [Crocinitomix sp.]|nr:hypothetical protein [Crocinitomix sp.]